MTKISTYFALGVLACFVPSSHQSTARTTTVCSNCPGGQLETDVNRLTTLILCYNRRGLLGVLPISLLQINAANLQLEELHRSCYNAVPSNCRDRVAPQTCSEVVCTTDRMRRLAASYNRMEICNGGPPNDLQVRGVLTLVGSLLNTVLGLLNPVIRLLCLV